ncbi:MAG TPA: Trm112 family protein [Candidatus Hydrogenedentes bacterium]|nr:Trm112 family protein [Candidatus Hydrogenedentota bacterium]HOS02950.1 Trm112 family protein [Candidatus Hydrogenedentota bacterium]
MVDVELLKLLVCPDNKTALALADDALVARINAAIRQGGVTNRAGEAVDAPIEGGLVREDGKYLYPIRDDIPEMIIDEAIPLDALG